MKTVFCEELQVFPTLALPPCVSSDISSNSFRMSSSLWEKAHSQCAESNIISKNSWQRLKSRRSGRRRRWWRGGGVEEEEYSEEEEEVSYSKSSFLAPFFFFFPFGSLEAPAPSISAARASMSMPSSLALGRGGGRGMKTVINWSIDNQSTISSELQPTAQPLNSDWGAERALCVGTIWTSEAKLQTLHFLRASFYFASAPLTHSEH